MANVMRWRYGDTNPVVLAVYWETVIEIGDLVVHFTSGVRPANYIRCAGAGLGVIQKRLHNTFAGVAMSASGANETDPIRVATGGVFEFDMEKATVLEGIRIRGTHVGEEPGKYPVLSNQKVVQTVGDMADYSIGRCAKLATSATSVLVAINSTVIR